MKHVRSTIFVFLLLVSSLTFAETLKIAFGSCNNQWVAQPLWKRIVQYKPNLWIWAGDNVYIDRFFLLEKLQKDEAFRIQATGSSAPVSALDEPTFDRIFNYQYFKQLSSADYQHFLASRIPYVGAWDNHDYGIVASARIAKKHFLNFIRAPLADPRRYRNGNYVSYVLGKPGKQVKVILLDNLSFVNPQTQLGQEQWAWLESQFKNSTASAHILVSSIQVISSDNPQNKRRWSLNLKEREKLFSLFNRYKPKNLVLLSGDRHLSELAKLPKNSPENKLGYDLYDLTSSGLTHAYVNFPGEANQYRVPVKNPDPTSVENTLTDLNFGSVEVEWLPQNKMRMRLMLHTLTTTWLNYSL